jgi:hypothetical protein
MALAVRTGPADVLIWRYYTGETTGQEVTPQPSIFKKATLADGQFEKWCARSDSNARPSDS